MKNRNKNNKKYFTIKNTYLGHDKSKQQTQYNTPGSSRGHKLASIYLDIASSYLRKTDCFTYAIVYILFNNPTILQQIKWKISPEK